MMLMNLKAGQGHYADSDVAQLASPDLDWLTDT
jgi:hypothetical protein